MCKLYLFIDPIPGTILDAVYSKLLLTPEFSSNLEV
jgi:hypothetical protein